MNVVITFGRSTEAPREDRKRGAYNEIWRRGFSVAWAQSVESRVLFSLKVQIRINDIWVEQNFTVMDGANA